MRSSQGLALVAYGPISADQWKLERLRPRAIREDEVLVRIVASGVCHADLQFGNIESEKATGGPAWYPRVLGHEGAGYVEQVGAKVTTVLPSDPVLLSYLSCSECYSCESGHPAYCTKLFEINFHGEKGVYAAPGAEDFDIGGGFFGQSSFSNHAIVKARCVVNLAGLGVSKHELLVLPPLGCGVQTGAGAMVNIADVGPQHHVAIIGVGGVGQSAVMAAAMRGCQKIIAIDRVPSRLEIARSLGATNCIDSSDPEIDLVSEVRRLTGGYGVHVSLDTSGVQSLARQSWDFVRCYGKVLQVGLAKPDDVWSVPMADHMNSGKQIIGCVEGDAIPQRFIPDMIQWYRQGKLPIERIVKIYPVHQFKEALEDMRKGTCIKPVLSWAEPHVGLL